MRLGIDFGTTRTVVAAVDDGRYPVASFDMGDGYRDYLPGLVGQRDGALVFGEEARQLLLHSGHGALTSIKRAVTGLTPEDLVPDLEGVTALELVTAFLQWVRRMLIERSNLEVHPEDPLAAMVAVPANAGTRQRYLTLEAFRRAEFEVLGLVAEPTAAAIEFAHRNTTALSNRSPKRYVVVYDLGGGTFDTAAVSLRDRRFELLAARGIGRLGGSDFDEIILEMATDGATSVAELDPSTRVAMLEACREAKEGLRPNSRKLLVDLAGIDARCEAAVLDTGELYLQCEPLIERTLTMVDELFSTLEGRGVDPNDPRQLGALYLVGGSAAFPALTKVLRNRFKRKIQLAPQPHAATAVGLAVAADPAAHIFVREAVTRHFGVWREADGGRDKVFDPIISRDTEPPSDDGPIVVQRCYRPAHPIGHLRFLECTDLDAQGQPAGDMTPWEEVHFPYDPMLFERAELIGVPIERRAAPLEEDIVETYTHDKDGTIAVQIENRTRGYRRSYVLGALR